MNLFCYWLLITQIFTLPWDESMLTKIAFSVFHQFHQLSIPSFLGMAAIAVLIGNWNIYIYTCIYPINMSIISMFSHCIQVIHKNGSGCKTTAEKYNRVKKKIACSARYIHFDKS
jgi:hypothetical protein